VCCGLKGHKIVHWVQGQVSTMFTLFPPAYCPGVSPSPFQQLHLLYPIHIILLFSLQDDLILCVNSCTSARIHTITATENAYCFALLCTTLQSCCMYGTSCTAWPTSPDNIAVQVHEFLAYQFIQLNFFLYLAARSSEYGKHYCHT